MWFFSFSLLRFWAALIDSFQDKPHLFMIHASFYIVLIPFIKSKWRIFVTPFMEVNDM